MKHQETIYYASPMPILFAIQTVFSVWMLIDAARRGAQHYWFYVILMPFGELVYFFSVKVHDPQFKKVKRKLFDKPTTLKEIRYLATSSPSVHNKTILGQALYDHKEYNEAAQIFREVTHSDQNNKAALYGLGLCLINLSQTKDAISALEQLIELDLTYDDYSPCADLAQAYWRNGEKDSCITLLEQVVRKSGCISHKTELARYLAKVTRETEARRLLEEALMDYENSPRYLQKSQRMWAKEARSVLKKL